MAFSAACPARVSVGFQLGFMGFVVLELAVVVIKPAAQGLLLFAGLSAFDAKDCVTAYTNTILV